MYTRVSGAFHHPGRIEPAMLRDALLWKYGHLGKPRIPPGHQRLITHLQRSWPAAVAALPKSPEAAFDALDREYGGKTRFVTVAFLLHLLHERNVPIMTNTTSERSLSDGWRETRLAHEEATIPICDITGGGVHDGRSPPGADRIPRRCQAHRIRQVLDDVRQGDQTAARKTARQLEE